MPMACDADLLAPATGGHLDEVFLKINGRLRYPLAGTRPGWRRIGHLGSKAEEIGKLPRNSFAKVLKGLGYVPCVLITVKLRSYSAAKTQVLPSVGALPGQGAEQSG